VDLRRGSTVVKAQNSSIPMLQSNASSFLGKRKSQALPKLESNRFIQKEQLLQYAS